MCPHQRSQLAFLLRGQLDWRSFVSRQDISPLRSRGRFATLMDSRPWSLAAKSHFCANCGKCDSVCQAGSTESPNPARCTRQLPKGLPDDGRVLVHNNVRPSRKIASRGFRAWLATPDERWVVCDCGWAPELG